MKVYISADIEGISGLVAWSQCGGPGDGYDWAFARRRLTADVNAAIRGARAGGAEEVLVKDSHGCMKNLLADELELNAELVSGLGAGRDGMMIGIDNSFDAALLIGYHAKAGTPQAVMEHSFTNTVHGMWIEDLEVGEIGMSAGIAGAYGVPVVMIASDKAGCREAADLLPDIATVETKEGIGRHLAKLHHPSAVERSIESAAREAVRRCKAMSPWRPPLPAPIRIRFTRVEFADSAARLPGVIRVDGYTVEAVAASFHELHQLAWVMIGYGGVGRFSND
ncbi:MAG: D-aminopeptidase [Fimbriimonadaceae bacterium]|nr:D-aminopeptidase [Fimbriimonadaceae bacterium]